MSDLPERLESVALVLRPAMELARSRLHDPFHDRVGDAAISLVGDLKFFAIVAFAIDHDVERFRALLRESAMQKEDVYDRFEAGEPIDGSYVSLFGYKSLFDALASGDLTLAARFASKLGGRPQIERKHDHPFTRAVGPALKHLVLASGPEASPAVAAFAEACGKKGHGDYAGYPVCMRAILDRDSEAFSAGAAAVLACHKKLCRPGRMFDLGPDEVICTWLLGLANLAVSRGLSVSIDHPYVPRALILA